jgi:hypothetical protein
MMKKSRIKICLAKDCKSKQQEIIKAHALQENRILNKLELNNFIIMQDFTKDPVMLEIKKGHPEPFYFLNEVYLKNATVATCFCKKHDNKLFEKIEKFQYNLSDLDEEQQFLFAYKTLSFEIYTEIVAEQFNRNMVSNVPQLAKDPMFVHKFRNTELRLKDLQYYRDFFDKALESKDYSELETAKIEIPCRIQFANFMTIAPPYDIKGRKINSINRKINRMSYIFFTIFPEEKKSYILISILKKDIDIFGRYLEEMKKAPLGLVEYYLNVFIPLYSQNLIISPALWNGWDEIGQLGVQYAVAEHKNIALVRGLQMYLGNIAKGKIKENIEINSSKVQFDFFKPYEGNI